MEPRHRRLQSGAKCFGRSEAIERERGRKKKKVGRSMAQAALKERMEGDLINDFFSGRRWREKVEVGGFSTSN